MSQTIKKGSRIVCTNPLLIFFGRVGQVEDVKYDWQTNQTDYTVRYGIDVIELTDEEVELYTADLEDDEPKAPRKKMTYEQKNKDRISCHDVLFDLVNWFFDLIDRRCCVSLKSIIDYLGEWICQNSN